MEENEMILQWGVKKLILKIRGRKKRGLTLTNPQERDIVFKARVVRNHLLDYRKKTHPTIEKPFHIS